MIKFILIWLLLIIILQLVVVAQGYVNIQQSRQIEELRQQIKCLEQDRIYVGFTFCVNKTNDSRTENK